MFPTITIRLINLIKRYRLEKKKKTIERINFFGPILPSEYTMVKDAHRWKKFPRPVMWSYGNLEEDLTKGFENKWVSGDSILIGNSAHATNNHFEVFELLSKMQLSNRKVIVPLSYGDLRYRRLLIKKGLYCFSSTFVPLVEFMPIEKYVEFIKSCGFIIMNHVRQQALGNLVIMLYMGAKIFLRDENPIAEFLREEGAVIFTVQELCEHPEWLSFGLSQSEKEINRQVAIKNWSKKTVDQKAIQLLKTILGNDQIA
jgi:hypothetical protein